MNTMTFNRTPSSIELNKQLEIVRLDDYDFPTLTGRANVRGWGFRIPGRGFIRFKSDNPFIPYSPCGGHKALQKIIDDGGFIHYDDLAFVIPMTYGERVFCQYAEMKHKHPDAVLLFRTGDFYETFANDAVDASKILGLTLTRRPNRNGFVYYAGFPHNALDKYLPKIIRAGRRVAICEQIDEPKKYCKRGISQ